MGTTLSTLTNLAIYIGLVVVGAFIGSRKGVRSRPLVWVGKLQFVALMILIVTLGVNLGANDEVIASLGQIGLAALLITVLAMLGSILFLSLLRRFVLRLDHVGLPRGSVQTEEQGEHTAGKADNSLTKWIVIAVVLGMLAGRFVLPPPLPSTAARSSTSGSICCCLWWVWIWASRAPLSVTSKQPGFRCCWCRWRCAPAPWCSPPWRA